MTSKIEFIVDSELFVGASSKIGRLINPDYFSVAIIGDRPELGQWDHEKCIEMKQMEDSRLWRVVLSLPAGVEFRFKYIVKYKAYVAQWETIPNGRAATSPLEPDGLITLRAVLGQLPEGHSLRNQGRSRWLDWAWLTPQTGSQVRFTFGAYTGRSAMHWVLGTGTTGEQSKPKRSWLKLRIAQSGVDFGKRTSDPDLSELRVECSLNRKAHTPEEDEERLQIELSGELPVDHGDIATFRFHCPLPKLDSVVLVLEALTEDEDGTRVVAGRSTMMMESLLRPDLRRRQTRVSRGAFTLPLHAPGSRGSNPELAGSAYGEFCVIDPLVHPNNNLSSTWRRYWNRRRNAVLDVGHRGLGRSYRKIAGQRRPSITENTLLSFASAGLHGAEMVELDVMLTRDRVPVIFHDFDLGVNAEVRAKYGEARDQVAMGIHQLWLTQVKSVRSGPVRERQPTDQPMPKKPLRHQRNAKASGNGQLTPPLSAVSASSTLTASTSMPQFPSRSVSDASIPSSPPSSPSPSLSPAPSPQPHSMPLMGHVCHGADEVENKVEEDVDDGREGLEMNEGDSTTEEVEEAVRRRAQTPQPFLQASPQISPLSSPALGPSESMDPLHSLLKLDRSFREIVRELPTLEEAFARLPSWLGINIEIKYPINPQVEWLGFLPEFELNAYIDAILRVVLQHAGDRRIVFSCFHPDMALAMQLKQTRYPVLFLTCSGDPAHYLDHRANSLEAALSFARCELLEGLVANSTPLFKPDPQVPGQMLGARMTKLIRDMGLVLFTWGDLNSQPTYYKLQRDWGVDAIIADNITDLTKERGKQVSVYRSAVETEEDKQWIAHLEEREQLKKTWLEEQQQQQQQMEESKTPPTTISILLSNQQQADISSADTVTITSSGITSDQPQLQSQPKSLSKKALLNINSSAVKGAAFGAMVALAAVKIGSLFHSSSSSRR